MSDLFVDTNILIDYSKGYKGILENLLEAQQEEKVILHVNPIVIAEFFTDDTLKKKEVRLKAQEFFSFFEVQDITRQIGYLAGDLLRDRKVSFMADAIIAATCIICKFYLVTRNRKHFLSVSGLKFWEMGVE